MYRPPWNFDGIKMLIPVLNLSNDPLELAIMHKREFLFVPLLSLNFVYRLSKKMSNNLNIYLKTSFVNVLKYSLQEILL